MIAISPNMRQVFDLADRAVVFRWRRICANLDVRNQDISGEDTVANITDASTQPEHEETTRALP